MTTINTNNTETTITTEITNATATEITTILDNMIANAVTEMIANRRTESIDEFFGSLNGAMEVLDRAINTHPSAAHSSIWARALVDAAFREELRGIAAWNAFENDPENWEPEDVDIEFERLKNLNVYKLEGFLREFAEFKKFREWRRDEANEDEKHDVFLEMLPTISRILMALANDPIG